MRYQVSFQAATVKDIHIKLLKQLGAKKIEFLGVDNDGFEHYHCDLRSEQVAFLEISDYWQENGWRAEELD